MNPQRVVLTRRYRTVVWRDFGTLALLVGQAPLIGWLCAVVWGSIEQDSPALYFVMNLACLWFGCIAACREVVKERAIVERERMFGLGMVAYVVSKFRVLAEVTFIQVVLLQLAIEWSINVQGPFLLHTITLYLVSICGIGLGLAVSALASRQERAVGVVPLLILPQILFSEIAIPKEHFSTAVQWMEWCMPVHWAYQSFTELAAVEVGWLTLAASWLMMLAMIALFFVLTVFILLRKREF